MQFTSIKQFCNIRSISTTSFQFGKSSHKNTSLANPFLTTPKSDIEAVVSKKVKEFSSQTNLTSQFSDMSSKFSVLSAAQKEFNREIPSFELMKLKTPKDVIEWLVNKFESEKPQVKPELPSNLIMVTDSLKKKQRLKAVPKTVTRKSLRIAEAIKKKKAAKQAATIGQEAPKSDETPETK